MGLPIVILLAIITFFLIGCILVLTLHIIKFRKYVDKYEKVWSKFENKDIKEDVENLIQNMEITKQISKNDIASLVGIEIEDIANKLGVNDKLFLYKFNVQDSLTNRDNNRINILYTDRTEIEQYSKIEGENNETWH